MPEWLLNGNYLSRGHMDNFDGDPNTVSPYDAMGTPTPTGWSPVFPASM